MDHGRIPDPAAFSKPFHCMYCDSCFTQGEWYGRRVGAGHPENCRFNPERAPRASVTFIVGLCGSGKSYLGRNFENQGAHRFDEGFLKSKAQHRDLIRRLKCGEQCVVIEIAYCIPKYRTKILNELAREVPGVNIRWFFYANDRKTADHNCTHREGGKRNPAAHLKINRRLTKRYVIPKFVRPIAITKIPVTPCA